MKKITQRERVMQFMREHHGITAMDAFGIGITQLAARIFELEHDGVKIHKESITVKNRYGEPCTITEYSLGELA